MFKNILLENWIASCLGNRAIRGRVTGQAGASEQGYETALALYSSAFLHIY